MNKQEVWDKFFGIKSEALDYSGRKVMYMSYKNRSSKYGWDIEYIRPVSQGDIIEICNVHIVNYQTKDERCNAFPQWIANDKEFLAIETTNHGYTVKEI